MDTLAERLRRRPAKPMGSPRMGSNPIGVAFCQKAWHAASMHLEKSVMGTLVLAFSCNRLIVFFGATTFCQPGTRTKNQDDRRT